MPLQDLPCRWFAHINDADTNKPSDYVLSKVMASFGEIRAVDIPLCDPYRKKMSASINGIKTFSFGQDLVFEAYVQFKEYIGFAKCMHALQGKKLVFLEGDKAWSASIKVGFGTTVIDQIGKCFPLLPFLIQPLLLFFLFFMFDVILSRFLYCMLRSYH